MAHTVQELTQHSFTKEDKSSTNSSNIQVNVKGWKSYYNDSNYTVYYNDKLVTCFVHTGNVSTNSNWQEFHTILTADWIKPSYHICGMDKSGNCVVRITGDTGKVGFKNVRNASETVGGVYCEIVWKLR